MGDCVICGKPVFRSDGFIMKETWFPEIKKEYIHHSASHRCFEQQCKKEQEAEEGKKKKNLNLPDNPLDDLWKDI
tara:strand:- start:35 stop:259 length:225 start_codon:yes stop_codon:yes gene_type:complete